MSVLSVPAGLYPASLTWEQQRNDMEFRSVFGAQVTEATAPLWAVALTIPTVAAADSGAWLALLMKLRGKTNQLALHNYGRPAPLGTMRGAMTLNSSAAQGATALSVVASGENSKTLLQGDLLGVGTGTATQVVMVVADATSGGSGIIALTVEPPLRNAHNAGAAVTWDKPTALFRCREAPAKWEHKPGGLVGGIALNLIEDVRP